MHYDYTSFAAGFSADIITRYYNNEIEPFLAACHPDVLWIGPANTQIIRTRETLIKARLPKSTTVCALRCTTL